MREELEAAKTAVKEAGKIIMDYYGKIKEVNVKKDKSIVTEADKKSEDFIKKFLNHKFPDYSFIGEESGSTKKSSQYTWVVDPLDGTTNFSIMNPFFNISIALSHGTEPVIGVVYFPLMDELFYASKGKGAFLNSKTLNVSEIDDPDRSFVMFCHGGKKEHIKKALNAYSKMKYSNQQIRQVGAAALELCYVAAGRSEAFFMPGANSWDVAAGQLIVREAGGKVTDLEGEEYDINSEGIIASNSKMHGFILDILK